MVFITVTQTEIRWRFPILYTRTAPITDYRWQIWIRYSNGIRSLRPHNFEWGPLLQLEAGQAGEELYNEPSFNQARHVANPLFDGDEEGEGEVVVAEDNQLEQPSVAEMGEEDYLDVNDPEDGAQ
eukprot:m.145076 g.145076  ORF g.145076 m.145076 type:complete len:125 (+) comp16213_c0_seq2:3073-3447(+)